jgi:transcriptional regulator with XRE-family HTH domain
MGTDEVGQKVGPTGRRVMRNLKELRGRIPVRELSQRLAHLGRPIVPSGITKMEQGSRRVDVDDLVALALALDVSPNRLLLDATADDEPVALTEGQEVSRRQGWEWATGHEPMPERLWDEDRDRRHILNFDRLAAFRAENRPNEPEPKGTQANELLALGEKFLQPVVDAAERALATGEVTFDQIVEYLQLSHTVQSTVRAIIAAHPDNPANKPKRARKSTRSKGGR